MSLNYSQRGSQTINTSLVLLCITFGTTLSLVATPATSQQDSLTLKTDTLTIDLFHKFGPDAEFKPRGSIVIKPKTEHKAAQAFLQNQVELTEADINDLKLASDYGKLYYLKASLRANKKDNPQEALRTTQTLVKSCSLYSSNLVDFLIVNLSPLNDFLSVNLYTADLECVDRPIETLSRKFNSTVLIETGSVGPVPDTATYIKRLEEERQSKLRDGKEDNRSFFAKYWMYIVPGVILLMVMSGPEQGGAR